MDSSHVDYPVISAIRAALGAQLEDGLSELTTNFPIIVRDAIDFLLDPVNTARTTVAELDNVEKTFIGLKLEHFLRDMLDAPKKIKRDLYLAGYDVDIKNTVGSNWSIPQETYRTSEPCLLMIVDDGNSICSLGLFVARREYLHGGVGNRDTKRGVSREGWKSIMWLLEDEPFPKSKFAEFDMDRFRQLRRTIKHGTPRAAQFLRENLGRPIHRSVIEGLLFDQLDPMKRVRGNQGARDILKKEDIAIASVYHSKLLVSLGLRPLRKDEFMAVKLTTRQHLRLLEKPKKGESAEET